MNKVYTTIIFLLLSIIVLAQSPEKISYQAVIRNAENNLVTNQQVGMQISILQGSVDGTTVYSETLTPNTNANGLVSIEIGSGNSTDDFSTIEWSNGIYFVKTETDIEGGTNYTITGVSQLLSVPYALFAKKAGNVPIIDGLVSQQALEDSLATIHSEINNKGFGTWSVISSDSIYEAETDGFLYGFSNSSNQCSGHVAHLYTGSTQDDLNEFYLVERTMKFIFPITKGSFYKLMITVESFCDDQNPSISLYWMPLY